MAEEPIKLPLIVEVDKSSTKQSAEEIRDTLEKTVSGNFNDVSSNLKAAFSRSFEYAKNAASTTSDVIRQKMYDALSSRYENPTFKNLATQVSEGFYKGLADIGHWMATKLREGLGLVDGSEMAENVGQTLESSIKAYVHQAFANANIEGGFVDGSLEIDPKAFVQASMTRLANGRGAVTPETIQFPIDMIERAVDAMVQLHAEGKETSDEYATWEEKLNDSIGSIVRLLGVEGEVASEAEGVGEALDPAEEATGGINSTLRVIATQSMPMILAIAQKLGSTAFKGMQMGLNALVNKFKQLNKTASKTMDNTSKKMKRVTLQMIRAGLGVRGLYMLFRKLRNAIKEGMDILAKDVPEFNTVLSNFKTALNQIKGSIGSAFQPILQVVLPILTQLLGMLNSVIEAIARFNAVLMGQGYIYKFTASYQDYAKKLKGVGGAAKKAGKDLMGFDEINRLSDKGGGDKGIGEYEKQLIDMEDAMSKFAQMVKDAWKKADFTDVGRYIGEALKNGLSLAQGWLDTEGQAWATRLSDSLSTLINGLVDVDGLGYQLGSTLGSGFNVAITFLKNFWTDTNFVGIGEQVGGAINGLFDTVDWEGLGTYFGEKFNGIFEFIGGLANSTDWINIGTSLSESLNTMIQTMDVGMAAQSASSLITGILDSGITFITQTDWDNMGTKIGDGLNNIDFRGIIGKSTKLIASGAQGLWDMITGAIQKTSWIKVGEELTGGLIDAVSAIWNDGKLIEDLVEGVISLLEVLIGLILGALKELLWDNLIVPIFEHMKSVFEEQYDETGNIGAAIVLGICEGIIDALTGIGLWLYDNVFLPIINGIKDAFGIHSPAQSMIDIGLELIAGLYDGLTGIWDSVKDIFDNLKEEILGFFAGLLVSLKEKYDEIKTSAQEKWENIKESILEKVRLAKTNIIAIFTTVKDKVLEKFRSIRDTGIAIWEGLWNGIKKVINWILGGVNDMIRFALGGINELIEKLNGAKIELPNGMTIGGANIPTIPVPQIPLLAQGAVLPPNNPFLAMVGDQTSGTNVEAPLETIKQATAEVMDEYLEGMMAGFEAVVQAIENKNTDVYIGDKQIGEANDRYTNSQNFRRGFVQ